MDARCIHITPAAAAGPERSKVLLGLIEKNPNCTPRDLWRALAEHWRCSEASIRRLARRLEDAGLVVSRRGRNGSQLVAVDLVTSAEIRGELQALCYSDGWAYSDRDSSDIWWPARRASSLSDLRAAYAMGRGRWST
jgi:biotin operon repressor